LADRPSSSDPSPSTGKSAASGKSADSRPPGLGAQFGRTRSALLGLVSAHLKLLSTELSEIMDEIKRAVALGGIALAVLALAGVMAVVGSVLWLDEWAFGSIGWGALHGTTLLIAVTVTLVMLIIPHAAPRVGLAFFVALLVAVVVGLILWLQLTSRAWGWVGDSFFGSLTSPFDGHAISAAHRPIAAGVIVLAVLFGVVGAIVGFVVESGLLNRVAAAVGIAIVGALLGGLLGGLLGVPMSWGIAIAVALAVFLVLYAVLAAFLVLKNADFEELKNRLLPNQTIETTKETIEWVREQMPLGRKS
jgi:uncharacterized membrane protein YqjE